MACQGCTDRERVIRELADTLSRSAGAAIGGYVGGPAGAVIGSKVAPKVIESGAMAVKKKRAPSAYNRRYAAAFKKLKRAHPKTQFRVLSKRAHKLAKK